LNTPGYVPPQTDARSDLRSRESTAPLDDEKDQAIDATSYPRLQLDFDTEPKSNHGLMMGTDPSCDVVLPRLRKISQRHCYLTFDAERRLVLRDCSTHGTIVKYDGKGGELRRNFMIRNTEGRELHHNFTWTLSGHEFPRNTRKIVIEIPGISFQIDVAHHDNYPDQYNANVDRFLQRINEPRLNVLGIHSPTAPPSQSYTPNPTAIRLKHETLGKGASAVVKRFWDVSTCIEYAYKEPRDKRNFDSKIWTTEINIMRQISHVGRTHDFGAMITTNFLARTTSLGSRSGCSRHGLD
jgi:hypothetical protein